MWIAVAFAAPVLWAVSTHLDKYLVDRYFKQTDVGPLLVFTGLINLPFIAAILFFDANAIELPLRSAALITVTGILYMGAMYFYLQALQSEDATVVAPFFQLAPIFTLALAYLVLHELPTLRQGEGGALILAGGILLSFDPDRTSGRLRTRLIVLMIVCAFALAISSVVFKLFAIRDEFWSTTFWTYLGESIFGVGILLVPSLRRAFTTLVRSNTKAVLAVNGANELINLSGSIIARYAFLLGPLAVVQAIASTTTLFVFFFSVVISVFLPRIERERLSVRDVAQKGLAAALVAGGVTLLSLAS